MDFVVRVVLGLLAITIGLDTLSGDRDTGTLHAILGQPIPSWVVLTSKVTGAMASLALAVGLVVVSLIGAAHVRAPEVTVSALSGFLATFAALALLYLLTLVSCALLIASMVKSARTAHTIGVLAWLYAAMVAPQLIVFVGRAFAGPPRTTVESQLQATYASQSRTIQETLGNALAAESAKPGQATGPTLLAPTAALKLDTLWKEKVLALQASIDQAEAGAEADERRQDRAVRVSRLASPAAQFSDALGLAADSGRSLRSRWQQSVRSYQTTLDTKLFDDQPHVVALVPNGTYRSLIRLNRKEAPTVWSLPQFDAPTESLRERLRDALPNFVVLGLYSTVFLVGAFVAFARTDL